MPIPFLFQAVEQTLLTLWVGGLWITGLVYAPVLFAGLDRLQAGDIAGRLFSAMSLVSLTCGAILLVFATARARQRVWRDWRAAVLLMMLLIALIGEYGLAVRMRELKLLAVHQINAAPLWAEFGRLHGLSSALYLTECVLGLLLVVLRVRPRTQAGN
jgi:cytochrome c biogenesis protein CcdA